MPWQRGVSIGSTTRVCAACACRRARTGASCSGGSRSALMSGYKWLARWQAGDRELADHSRRPHAMPEAQRGCDRSRDSGCPRRASRLGCAQDRPLPERDGRDGACAVDGASDPVPERPGASRARMRRQSEAIASRRKLPICCGRWTSRATCRSPTGRVPSADRARRSLALCAVSESLRQRARLDHAGASDARPSVAMACRSALHRQRLALGRYVRRPLDRAEGLVAQARRHGRACPALSPAVSRQERALPSHAQGGGVCYAPLPHPAVSSARLRCLAHRLQSRASPPGPRTCTSPPDRFPAQFACHARSRSSGEYGSWQRSSPGLLVPASTSPSRARTWNVPQDI